MGRGTRSRSVVALVLFVTVLQGPFAQAEKLFPLVFPEQRAISVRSPDQLAPVRISATPPPETVSKLRPEAPALLLSLDEAIRTALVNMEVVRVLAGVSTTAAAATIYDAAITNVTVDEAQARFDPFAMANNTFARVERPVADLSAVPPVVGGTQTNSYDHAFGLSKTTTTGGTLNFGVNATPTRIQPGGLEQTPSSVDLSFTQPLLQGGGFAANLAPIVLARIDTERSYFQFKDSVQEHVRGVIDAYWRLVLARVEVWVREQQVQQLEEALKLAEQQFATGLRDGGPVQQARVSLFNFRASLLASRSSQLNLEAGLRNMLGFPPYDGHRIVPITPPQRDRLEMDWNGLIDLASFQRPDIIELKLILEADQQRLLQAENQNHARVDALALYRWNGLEGEVPALGRFSSRPGQFTDWTFGVNFSVPLGLRAARANVRRQELLISRDRALLSQSLHNAAHILAGNLRNLDQFYEQYLLFRETRVAARFNVQQQSANFDFGRGIFLDVLQAIASWGDSVNAEAQSLMQYNLELASLERQTGTILESHGIRLLEERFGSIGPLGRHHPEVCYPSGLAPGLNDDRYQPGERPAEETFNLQSPARVRRRGNRPEQRRLPPPSEGPPPASSRRGTDSRY